MACCSLQGRRPIPQGENSFTGVHASPPRTAASQTIDDVCLRRSPSGRLPTAQRRPGGRLVVQTFATLATGSTVGLHNGHGGLRRFHASRRRSAASFGWTQEFPATSPQGREFPAMAYDAAHGTVLMFGGLQGGNVLGDTWTWDGANWTRRFPATSPSPRTGSAMAYDPITREVVLFGGSDLTSRLGDTWTWDGANWTPQQPQPAPPPRDLAGIAYDASSKDVILFGGATSSYTFIGDTWAWDGATWTELFPAASPEPRTAVMAYDFRRRAIVLFGGIVDVAPITLLRDTWTWDGANWRKESPSHRPAARDFQGMAGDRDHVWLFAGAGNEGALADTWAWTGTTWNRLVTSSFPSYRAGCGMVYDGARRHVLLLGGSHGGTNFSDTWVLGPS
jgi:hypothetical protein